MTRIEAPPDADQTWNWYEICRTLRDARRPGRIATMTDAEYTYWSHAARVHREAWTAYRDRCIAEASRASRDYMEQGAAVGWLHHDHRTPT